MSLPESRAPKRRKLAREVEKPEKTSKARSCEACRRLKTRCEANLSFNSCHRCEILSIKCSFLSSRNEHRKQESEDKNHRCDCHSRLRAVETSLTQIQASLFSTDTENDRHETAQSIAERTARDAPMSLIQEIRENITLHRQPLQIQDLSEDVIHSRIISEETALILLKGFSEISSRWLFMGIQTKDLRFKSSLLFGTCILAGLHIDPSLHGSQMHQDIYRHVHGLLGQAQFAPAASLDTIQSMLIFSMWDLRPARDYNHGSSWLLSGMAAMRMVITTPFERLLQTNGIEEEDRARELMRTWNLICLCQLQFSVGSGRPPVIASQYFDQCAKVIEFPSYNYRDELVLSGVNLYRVLWELTSSNIVQKESPVWPEMQNLRKSQEHIYNLDSSEPLRFAYSCAYLILARRTLQHMNDPIGKSLSEFENTLTFARFAVHHAHQVLRLYLNMSELTTFIHPAYENLLCSFAMVTLAEFSSHVSKISETITLIERAVSHIQRGGKAEPVSRWSLNKIRKYAGGSNESELYVARADGAEGLDPSLNDHATRSSWLDNDWGLELDFPSLEEMFFGNVI